MNRRHILIFSPILLLLAGLASFSIKQNFNSNEQYRQYVESEQKYATAMASDTYGGKTSGETVDLFIASMKAGDIELASKYFMLGPNLSRDKWLKTLTIFKDQGLLDEMVGDIEKNPDLVELKLNEFSGIWKITNFR